MKTMTAFCCSAFTVETIWINSIGLPDGSGLEEFILEARYECAEAWDIELEFVHCLGLIEGDVDVVYWEDLMA